MKMMLLASALGCAVSANVFASPINFTDSSFSGANGQSSFTTMIDHISMTASAGPSGAKLSWSSTGGLGVSHASGYSPGEIEGAEILKLTFSEPIKLNDLFIANLFNEYGYLEQGWYSLNNNGIKIGFSAAVDQYLGSTNGELTVPVGLWVDTILFTSLGAMCGQTHEFSVAGIDAAHCAPEPATFYGMGVGLIGLWALVRRTRRAPSSPPDFAI